MRLAALCLLPLLAACGGAPSDADRWRALARLSQPPDAEVFDLVDVTRRTVVRSWPLTDTGDTGVWRIEPAVARGPADSRGTWLRLAAAGGQAPRLTADVDLDAAEVEVIELRLWQPGPISTELLWAGAGQLPAADRRIANDRPERDPDRQRARLFRFRVGEHPKWRGAVRRLEIRVASDAGGEVAVGAVRALREELNSRLLAAAAARAWKVDLRSTLKEARVALPGHPARAALTVPDGEAELRFVPGLPAVPPAGEVALSVRAVAGDGADELLFSATYSRAAGHEEGWQEPVRLPLTGLAGRELGLELAMSPASDGGAAGGFAAWGNLQLLARERGWRPPNVVLICLDTLRADRLSAYGHPRPTSPNIDRWAAQRAVLFEQVVAPAPWTLPSFASIFTGLDAIRHGVNHGMPAPAGLEMLAETLAREGYETVAWTGGGYLGPNHGLHQGFESFTYHLGPEERELDDNVARALAWLGASRDRPFFLLFHTYEVHEPFFERQPFHDRFAADSGLPRIPSDWVATRRLPRRPEEGFMVRREISMSPDRETWQPVPDALRPGVSDRYDAGIAYADERIGRLLAAIDETGMGPNTIVILTSDHGEALGEHGLGGHSYLYDFNLLVPLIIAAPSAGWPAGQVVRQQVRSVDIVPTVRELLDLEPDASLDGQSLGDLALGRRRAGDRLAWSYSAMANRGIAVRTPALKYFFNDSSPSPLFARERLVDLAADPDELDDIARERPEDAARFRRLVRRRMADDGAAIWLRLRSGSRHAMTVELSGPGVTRPSRLKALELPGDGIAYASEPVERAIVELPAGSEALLYFEPEAAGRIRLEVSTEAAGPVSRRWDLRLKELHAGAWAASVTGGGWVERAAGSDDRGPSLAVFSTRASGPTAGPDRTSRELEQQLRDLGYLQ